MSAEPRFRELTRVVMRDPALAGMEAIVEKELLHCELLSILQGGGWLDGLVFQGGTALRLCYGAPRLSEDLDFSGGPDFSPERLSGLAAALENALAAAGLDTSIRPPRNTARRRPEGGVGVSTWRIDIVTRPGRRDLPRQRIKLDIDSAPAHTREVRRILRNYGALRDRRMFVQVESPEEILANKLVAFSASTATRNRPRYRDVWDVHWLAEKGTEVLAELVRAKICEHRVDPSWLEQAAAVASSIVRSPEFSEEMRRFLPPELARRSLGNPKFMKALAETSERLLCLASACLPASSPAEDAAAGSSPFDIPDPFKPPSPWND